MAKRSFSGQNFTPVVVADTVAFVAGSNMMAIGAAAATNGLLVYEIMETGLGAASAINGMVFARDSTIGNTPTALVAPYTDGPLNSLSAAAQSGSLTYNIAATFPQRSVVTTSARLQLSFNAFGGIVRWVAAPGEEWGIVGITASISESTLSAAYGAPGAMSAHIIYEAY
jgi:hypothetical protein